MMRFRARVGAFVALALAPSAALAHGPRDLPSEDKVALDANGQPPEVIREFGTPRAHRLIAGSCKGGAPCPNLPAREAQGSQL